MVNRRRGSKRRAESKKKAICEYAFWGKLVRAFKDNPILVSASLWNSGEKLYKVGHVIMHWLMSLE